MGESERQRCLSCGSVNLYHHKRVGIYESSYRCRRCGVTHKSMGADKPGAVDLLAGVPVLLGWLVRPWAGVLRELLRAPGRGGLGRG